MARLRTFQGIANHAQRFFLLDMLQAPDDDGAGPDLGKLIMLDMGHLLPPELRVGKCCAAWGRKCWDLPEPGKAMRICKYRDENGICRPPRFGFKITVQAEEVRDESENIGP